MIPLYVSLWNPLCTSLRMEEKGKAINLETDKEEEDLEDLIIEEDEDEGMEEKTNPTHPPTKLRTYIPLRKGKGKVPKDLDESKSSL